MSKFIKNTNAGKITCKTKDGKLIKEFPIEQTNRYNGQTIHSGFTALTDEEFIKLSRESPGFKNALEKWKVFTVYDELPPEAKTPTETLADARKEVVEANGKATAAEAKAAELQKQLDDLKAKGEDSTAQVAGELATARQKVTDLETENATVKNENVELKRQLEELNNKLAEKPKGGK